MSVIDLEKFPFELYVNCYKEYPFHSKCECICKDTLINTLNNLLTINNFNKYNCYITGKINSSSQYPTFDCDLIITNEVKNDNEILQVLKDIMMKGFESNILFDVKYMENIDSFSLAVNDPDNLHEITESYAKYDISQNDFNTLNTITHNIRIRKPIFKNYTYNNPLLIKAANENTLNSGAVEYLNNTILPDSSEKNNENAHSLKIPRKRT